MFSITRCVYNGLKLDSLVDRLEIQVNPPNPDSVYKIKILGMKIVIIALPTRSPKAALTSSIYRNSHCLHIQDNLMLIVVVKFIRYLSYGGERSQR